MTVRVLSRRAIIGATAAVAAAGPARAWAGTLPQPTEVPILSVSGQITFTNDGAVARFDRPMLEALGSARIRTATPWQERPMEFEGVPLAALLRAVGATGRNIQALAPHDYSSELPISDVARYDPVLSLKLDGRYMEPGDKGPCFIIYPFDRFPELRRNAYYSRAVWMVSRIDVT